MPSRVIVEPFDRAPDASNTVLVAARDNVSRSEILLKGEMDEAILVISDLNEQP